MVAEEDDAGAIVYRRVFADEVLIEDGRHWCHVLVTEAEIGACESRVTGLDRRHSHLAIRRNHMPREDFLSDRHGPRLGVDSRNGHLALHARYIEGKEPAVLDHLARNLVFAMRENF